MIKLDFKALNCYQNGYIFQNGEVDTEEFMQAIRLTCIGKPFSELPNSFKGFIDSIFKTIDIDGTSSISSHVIRSNEYFTKWILPSFSCNVMNPKKSTIAGRYYANFIWREYLASWCHFPPNGKLFNIEINDEAVYMFVR